MTASPPPLAMPPPGTTVDGVSVATMSPGEMVQCVLMQAGSWQLSKKLHEVTSLEALMTGVTTGLSDLLGLPPTQCKAWMVSPLGDGLMDVSHAAGVDAFRAAEAAFDHISNDEGLAVLDSLEPPPMLDDAGVGIGGAAGAGSVGGGGMEDDVAMMSRGTTLARSVSETVVADAGTGETPADTDCGRSAGGGGGEGVANSPGLALSPQPSLSASPTSPSHPNYTDSTAGSVTQAAGTVVSGLTVVPITAEVGGGGGGGGGGVGYLHQGPIAPGGGWHAHTLSASSSHSNTSGSSEGMPPAPVPLALVGSDGGGRADEDVTAVPVTTISGLDVVQGRPTVQVQNSTPVPSAAGGGDSSTPSVVTTSSHGRSPSYLDSMGVAGGAPPPPADHPPFTMTTSSSKPRQLVFYDPRTDEQVTTSTAHPRSVISTRPASGGRRRPSGHHSASSYRLATSESEASPSTLVTPAAAFSPLLSGVSGGGVGGGGTSPTPTPTTSSTQLPRRSLNLSTLSPARQVSTSSGGSLFSPASSSSGQGVGMGGGGGPTQPAASGASGAGGEGADVISTAGISMVARSQQRVSVHAGTGAEAGVTATARGLPPHATRPVSVWQAGGGDSPGHHSVSLAPHTGGSLGRDRGASSESAVSAMSASVMGGGESTPLVLAPSGIGVEVQPNPGSRMGVDCAVFVQPSPMLDATAVEAYVMECARVAYTRRVAVFVNPAHVNPVTGANASGSTSCHRPSSASGRPGSASGGRNVVVLPPLSAATTTTTMAVTLNASGEGVEGSGAGAMPPHVRRLSGGVTALTTTTAPATAPTAAFTVTSSLTGAPAPASTLLPVVGLPAAAMAPPVKPRPTIISRPPPQAVSLTLPSAESSQNIIAALTPLSVSSPPNHAGSGGGGCVSVLVVPIPSEQQAPAPPVGVLAVWTWMDAPRLPSHMPPTWCRGLASQAPAHSTPVAAAWASGSGSGFGPAERGACEMLAVTVSQVNRRMKQVARALNASKQAYGLVEIVKAVSHEIGVTAILTRIISVAYELLAAERVSVSVVDYDNHELVMFVSEDVAGYRMPWGRGIAGAVLQSGKGVNIANAYSSPLFDRTVDMKSGYRTRSMLCMPIKHPDGTVVAVIQAINKREGRETFTHDDTKMLSVVADTAGVALHKAKLLEEAELARASSAALADVVRLAKEEGNDDIDSLTSRLVQIAYRLVDADRITLFLVDEVKQELFCQVSQDMEGMRMVRIPLGQGIAGAVALSGQVQNIPDAYEDPRFNRAMDVQTNFRTRSMLCMPVKLVNGRIVAVIQAINKRTGGPFTRTDEELLLAFSTEVGAVIDRKSVQLAYDKVIADEETAEGGGGGGGMMASLLTQYVRMDEPTVATTHHGLPRGGGGGGRGLRIHPTSTRRNTQGEGATSSPHGLGASGSVGGPHTSERRISGSSVTSPHLPLLLTPSPPLPSPSLPLQGPGGMDSMISASSGSGDVHASLTLPPGIVHVPASATAAAVASAITSSRRGSASGRTPHPPLSVRSVGGAGSSLGDGGPPVVLVPMAAGGPGGDGLVDGDRRAGGGVSSPLHHPLTPGSGMDSTSLLRPIAPDLGGSATHSPGSSAHRLAPSAAVAHAASMLTSSRSAGGRVLSARSADSLHSLSSRRGSHDAAVPMPHAAMPWPAAMGRDVVAAKMMDLSFDVLQYPDAELVPAVVAMLRHFDLLHTFGMDPGVVTGFVDAVRGKYRNNPYHNFKHGVSVAHVVFVALTRVAATESVFTPLDRLAVLVAGLCHDIDHPGFNNVYMVNTLDDLAIRYNDTSVLEHYHAATLFGLMDVRRKGVRRLVGGDGGGAVAPGGADGHGGGGDARSPHGSSMAQGRRRSGVAGTGATAPSSASSPQSSGGGADGSLTAGAVNEEVFTVFSLTKAELLQMRKVAIASILATDMQHHRDFIQLAKDTTPASAFDLSSKQMAELLVHVADLSNPVLPTFSVVYKWTTMVCTEFTAQVAMERQLGLPVAPHMDNLTTLTAIAKLQVGFVPHVVAPLWNAVAAALPELSDATANMRRNMEAWKAVAEGRWGEADILAGAADVLPAPSSTAATTSPSGEATAAPLPSDAAVPVPAAPAPGDGTGAVG